MARNRTAGELTASVRLRGDYEDSTGDYSDAYISDAVMLDFLDSALAEFWDLKVTTEPNRHVSTHTFTTAAGTQAYDIPADLFRLRYADVELLPSGSGEWIPIEPLNVSERESVANSDGRPGWYLVEGDQVTLSPTPDSAYGVRLRYIPVAARVTSSLQTIDGINGYEELPVLYTLRRCRVRSQESTVEVDQEIARQEARALRNSGHRDRGGPRTLEDPYNVRRRGRR